MRPRLIPVSRKFLIQPSLLPQTAQAANVRQREVEEEQIFVAYVGDGITPIFQRHAAAIPIVGGLRADKLQLVDIGVKAKTPGGAEATPGDATVSQGSAKLIETRGLSRTRRRSRGLPRYLQNCIASANRHLPDVVVQQEGTGIEAIALEVVIHIPLRVRARAGLHA